MNSWPEIAGDPRFFQRAGPHRLTEIAEAAGAVVPSEELLLTGVAPLQAAGPSEVSFLDNRKYASALENTRAGAVIVRRELAARVPTGTVPLVVAEPYAVWARIAALFHPLPPLAPGVHASAVVNIDARIDPSAEIGPLVVVAAGAEIGPRCRIGPLAIIGPGVVMGSDCRVGPHASLTYALIGSRVYVYPGARIGQEGFGFASTQEGFRSVPQLGRVILEDDVEVGANTTIDRGSLHDTVIGAGTRLDNLVQIGHNVRLGRGCVIVAQAGISGSTILGDHVMLGGQAGLTGHLRIGNKARIGAQAGVMADVPAEADVVGSPAQPVRAFFREVAAVRRLARESGKQAGQAGTAKEETEQTDTDRA